MRRPALVTIALVVALVLHQDFWNWPNRSLFLGILPVGLAYHVGYSLLASLLLAWVVRVAWPSELEADVTASREPGRGGGEVR